MRFDNYSLEKFRQHLLNLQIPDKNEIKEMEKRLEWMRNSHGEGQFNKAIDNFKNANPAFVDEFLQNMGSPEIVPVFSATGTLTWGDSLLRFTDNKIEDLKTKNIFRCVYITGGRTAFSFQQSGTTSIGVN